MRHGATWPCCAPAPRVRLGGSGQEPISAHKLARPRQTSRSSSTSPVIRHGTTSPRCTRVYGWTTARRAASSSGVRVSKLSADGRGAAASSARSPSSSESNSRGLSAPVTAAAAAAVFSSSWSRTYVFASRTPGAAPARSS
eukprot:Amastigsp_a519605_3.p3 type:complete len:141 gc:universal Amastigsp_a519605_3:64-486(+)